MSFVSLRGWFLDLRHELIDVEAVLRPARATSGAAEVEINETTFFPSVPLLVNRRALVGAVLHLRPRRLLPLVVLLPFGVRRQKSLLLL